MESSRKRQKIFINGYSSENNIFASLPQDIQLSILSLLPLKTQKNARLTCKYVSHLINNHFICLNVLMSASLEIPTLSDSNLHITGLTFSFLTSIKDLRAILSHLPQNLTKLDLRCIQSGLQPQDIYRFPLTLTHLHLGYELDPSFIVHLHHHLGDRLLEFGLGDYMFATSSVHLSSSLRSLDLGHVKVVGDAFKFPSLLTQLTVRLWDARPDSQAYFPSTLIRLSIRCRSVSSPLFVKNLPRSIRYLSISNILPMHNQHAYYFPPDLEELSIDKWYFTPSEQRLFPSSLRKLTLLNIDYQFDIESVPSSVQHLIFDVPTFHRHLSIFSNIPSSVTKLEIRRLCRNQDRVSLDKLPATLRKLKLPSDFSSHRWSHPPPSHTVISFDQ